MEECSEYNMERKENKRISLTGDRRVKRGYDIESKSHQTEIDVLWSCDARGWFGEGVDDGVWGGGEEKRTTKDQMDGGGAENSNEPCTDEGGDSGQERMETTGHDGRQGSTN